MSRTRGRQLSISLNCSGPCLLGLLVVLWLMVLPFPETGIFQNQLAEMRAFPFFFFSSFLNSLKHNSLKDPTNSVIQLVFLHRSLLLREDCCSSITQALTQQPPPPQIDLYLYPKYWAQAKNLGYFQRIFGFRLQYTRLRELPYFRGIGDILRQRCRWVFQQKTH